MLGAGRCLTTPRLWQSRDKQAFFAKRFAKLTASAFPFEVHGVWWGVLDDFGASEERVLGWRRPHGHLPALPPPAPRLAGSWGGSEVCWMGPGVERPLLTSASVLINGEYGLQHLKQWNYFSLANDRCSAETRELSMVLVPPSLTAEEIAVTGFGRTVLLAARLCYGVHRFGNSLPAGSCPWPVWV